ncbi:uncharacterized protein SOCE26_068670 [Sorangium cellulosum]|uniref:Uncharacterized protein n=1 Tax=Sorangium cellulosum TaxID=56 RepID=A0A2L0F1F2_SORCE|nr:hypothetical protein [Sorangium cellulosum]AUX45385.1 uncharacterized protein SOCE26_068670 [Sorangium cellulosum]
MVDILPMNQVVEIVGNDANLTSLGHAFATVNENKQQVQHWLLGPGYKDTAPPNGTVYLTQPRSSKWAKVRDVRSFVEAVQKTWVKGSQYVEANCFRKEGLTVLPNLKELDRMAPAFPKQEQAVPFQFDTGTGRIFDKQRTLGYVLATWLDDIHLREYWVLFDGYTPPAGDVEIGLGPRDLQTAAVSASFAAGAAPSERPFSLVITSCTYNDFPPSALG